MPYCRQIVAVVCIIAIDVGNMNFKPPKVTILLTTIKW